MKYESFKVTPFFPSSSTQWQSSCPQTLAPIGICHQEQNTPITQRKEMFVSVCVRVRTCVLEFLHFTSLTNL